MQLSMGIEKGKGMKGNGTGKGGKGKGRALTPQYKEQEKVVHAQEKPLFVLKQLFAFSFSGSFVSLFCFFFVACTACEHQSGWEA